MSARETKWKNEIVRDLRNLGVQVFQVVASMRQEAGWPDTYMSAPWWQGFIEFKHHDTATTTKQRIVIRRLRRDRPGGAYIVRYPDRIEDDDGRLICTFAPANATGLAWALRTMGQGETHKEPD